MTESVALPVSSGTTAQPRAVFFVTALGAFVTSLDLSIVNVAFPALQASFPHTSRAGLAWVVSGYAIVFGSLLVTGGRTADRLGRKAMFFRGLGLFLLGSALCGAAPTALLLVLGRLLQGAGAAFALPASLGLLLVAFPAERRSQIVALWGGVGALAVATGPSLGAAIISVGGWRWAFYVNLPVGALAFGWGRSVLVESRDPGSHGRPDYLGVALISAALATLALAISEGSDWGWTSVRVVLSLAISIASAIAFVHRSRRHPAPVLDLSLFSARSFSAANAATFVYALGFFPMLLGNILFLTGVWHYTILRAGLAVTPGPLVVATVSGPVGRLASRVGFRAPLAVGALFFAGGLSWYALRVGLRPDYLADWLPGTLITGFGIGLTFPVLSAAAVSSLPPARFGVGGAVNQTARQIGGSLGVAILVAVLGTPATAATALAGFRHLWTYAAAMALTSGSVAMLIGRRQLSPSGASAATATPPATPEPLRPAAELA